MTAISTFFYRLFQGGFTARPIVVAWLSLNVLYSALTILNLLKHEFGDIKLHQIIPHASLTEPVLIIVFFLLIGFTILLPWNLFWLQPLRSHVNKERDSGGDPRDWLWPVYRVLTGIGLFGWSLVVLASFGTIAYFTFISLIGWFS